MVNRVALAERLTRIEGGLERVSDEVGQLRMTLTGVLGELKAEGDRQRERVHGIEMGAVRLEQEVGTVQEDVRLLKRRGTVWDGINSVAAVVAGILAGSRRP